MASGVAHDFNNVLGAILARAQFLGARTGDPEVRSGLRVIEKAAQDGAETVKRIQEFTRVRTDRDFHPVDMNVVLDDVLEMTRSRWMDEAHRQGKRIEVARNLSEVPPVAGNVSELREVFTNLVLNAVDAISAEGQITVCTHAEGGRVVASVSDTGQGMSPEVKRRLFDPFFTTKGEKGNGLGMSIVYGIIRRHGGDIEVLSEADEGTMFRVQLPALAGEARPPERAADPSLPTHPGGRILVVDDEVDIREVVADILRDAGYEVDVADGGAAALTLVQERPYDLIITDLGMPGVGGWTVALESRAAQPAVRLVLLTGWGATLDPDEAARKGIDRILKKPFDMVDILRTAADFLAPAEARRAA
jgi:CheY-like chemotaxis protein